VFGDLDELGLVFAVVDRDAGEGTVWPTDQARAPDCDSPTGFRNRFKGVDCDMTDRQSSSAPQ